jgi:hypothetical protein
MGYTRSILAKKDVSDEPVFYTTSFRLDLAESFHLHYRNTRIEFSPEEWNIVSKGFFWGRLRWLFLGRPIVRPEEHCIKFWDVKVPKKIGNEYPSIRGSELAIELQEQTDYLHLHYRGLKLEFTIEEFLDFSQEIKTADEKLRNFPNIDDAPRRTGLDHKIQPQGRVDERANTGNFITDNRFVPEGHENTRKSIVFNEETQKFDTHGGSVDIPVTFPSKLYYPIAFIYLGIHVVFCKIFRQPIEKSMIRYFLDFLKI